VSIAIFELFPDSASSLPHTLYALNVDRFHKFRNAGIRLDEHGRAKSISRKADPSNSFSLYLSEDKISTQSEIEDCVCHISVVYVTQVTYPFPLTCGLSFESPAKSLDILDRDGDCRIEL
jgi:hypothetical protein